MTAFDIGEDRTQKHKSCTLGFICRWLLFMFLLVLYFRMLDDMPAGKSFFFVIFGLFAQFSHGKMQSQHKA